MAGARSPQCAGQPRATPFSSKQWRSPHAKTAAILSGWTFASAFAPNTVSTHGTRVGDAGIRGPIRLAAMLV